MCLQISATKLCLLGGNANTAHILQQVDGVWAIQPADQYLPLPRVNFLRNGATVIGQDIYVASEDAWQYCYNHCNQQWHQRLKCAASSAIRSLSQGHLVPPYQ